MRIPGRSWFRTEGWLNVKLCTYLQVSNLELRVAAHKEIDGDGGPDCRSEAELELVAGGADALGDHSETIGSSVVEGEVLDG